MKVVIIDTAGYLPRNTPPCESAKLEKMIHDGVSSYEWVVDVVIEELAGILSEVNGDLYATYEYKDAPLAIYIHGRKS